MKEFTNGLRLLHHIVGGFFPDSWEMLALSGNLLQMLSVDQFTAFQ